MENSKVTECEHRYIVNYLFRIPEPFFRSVECDICKSDIKLTISWNIFYNLFLFLGYLVAFSIGDRIKVKVFSTTFIVSFIIAVTILMIISQLSRIIIRYAKWKKY